MEVYFLWGGIGVFVLFLLIGLLAGLSRGLKRSSLHLIFFVASIILSFFITPPICNAILGININYENATYTIGEFLSHFIQKEFNMTGFETASGFLDKLPSAIAAPIVFLIVTLLCMAIFDIIYAIVARCSFGSKKKDFKEHKPFRAYGGIIGLMEGFMMLFILFAPLTSLTKTYQELATLPPAQIKLVDETQKLKTTGEFIQEFVPKEVNEAIFAYNKSIVGKISGAGGLDDALFDGLSKFNFDGEKIVFRKELLNVGECYNEFVDIYNKVQNKNYVNVDLTELKANINTFLTNGIFKTVISDTVKDLVVNFETLKDQPNFQNLPVIVKDMISDLNATFTAEDFEPYEYLKADILNAVDVADLIFKNNLISEYQNLEDKSFVGILDFVDHNNVIVKNISLKALNLNVVKDTFDTLGTFASEKLSEALKNDQGLEIALNTQIEDKDKMINDLLQAVNKFLDLNEYIDISSLLSSTDIIGTLSQIQNLDLALAKTGETFDQLKNLELLVLKKSETEVTYVFDNILKLYNINLLGDEVYLTPEAAETVTLDTYTKFFNYIKTPINSAKELGLMEIGKEGTSFDTIIDSVTEKLKTNESLLSDILLPFYQLQKASFDTTSVETPNLKAMIFDNVIDQLSTNISILKLEEIKAQNSLSVWNSELKLVGKTLNALNQGNIEVEQAQKTYLKYLMSGTYDLDTLLKEILNDNKLSDVLDPIFTAQAFENLTNDLFENINTAIGSLTGVVPTTDLTKLQETKTNVISTLQNLLNITLNNDLSGDFKTVLPMIGEVLDILKTNALNGGSRDGVFNNVFANIIWYMTGDVLNDVDHTGKSPNTNSSDIKAYLNVAETDKFVGYYTISSYKDIMTELVDLIDFAKDVNNSMPAGGLTAGNISTYMESINMIIGNLTGKTDEQKAELIDNLSKLLQNKNETIIDGTNKETFREGVVNSIDTTYNQDNPINVALKKLFGYNA